MLAQMILPVEKEEGLDETSRVLKRHAEERLVSKNQEGEELVLENK